jgi:SpoIIAA-like
MFTRIEGLPEGAIGFAAFGRITGADRQTVLEPTIESTISSTGKVRLLYVAGPEFVGYDRGGLYDETVFGTRHFTDFEKIAFVADDGPWGRAARAIDGLMPASVKVFAVNDIEGAKAWLAE